MFGLKKSESSHATALAMVGAKAGQSVVVLGADGPLAAAIGLVTGLNGRTVVVDGAFRTTVPGVFACGDVTGYVGPRAAARAGAAAGREIAQTL